ncbi:MAG: HesA/MoeB/ThiF family protein [Rhodospirillaceae bacterium]
MSAPDLTFSEDQIQRYARHILLPEVGGTGQARLLNSKVLVIGAGGLGSPLVTYLAAAGVGTIGVVDDDRVEASNLQRQILHGTADLGRPKVDSAADRVAALNKDVTLIRHPLRLSADTAEALIAPYDVIADGSDNFATRFLVNDACHFLGKTLVSAAVLRFDGQISTFKTHSGGPCYRCLYREPPPPGTTASCAEAGVLGAVTGLLGSYQAVEVMKELLGIGTSLSGRLQIFDCLSATSREVRLKPDPNCPLCSAEATITGLTADGALP